MKKLTCVHKPKKVTMKKLTCVHKPKKVKDDPNKNCRHSSGETEPTKSTKSADKHLKEHKGSKSKETTSLADDLLTKKKLTFVCISDTHCRLERCEAGRVPLGDVLLHAGDFTMDGTVRELQKFNQFLGTLPHKYKVVIAGNHEECLADDRAQHDKSIIQYYKNKYGVQHISDLLTNCIYLEDELTEIHGIKIYGSPWTPMYSSCDAFSLYNGDQLQKKWDKIPSDIDILMTHGPPRGFGDTTMHEIEAGCRNLLQTVQMRVKPKYHVFGHIHEGYGIYRDGTTTFINASVCTRGYKPLNYPLTFKMDIPDHADIHAKVVESSNNCDKVDCDNSLCDMEYIRSDNIDGPSKLSSLLCETQQELKTGLTGCDVNWNCSESDVKQINYTKLTEREVSVTSNEI